MYPGACLGFEVGGADYRVHKILPLIRMRELHVDGYVSRRGWKLHNIGSTTHWAVDDDQ